MSLRYLIVESKAILIPCVVFLFCSLLYLSHLSPAVYGYDSGDFLSAILTHGIPHPSGFPLYVVLGILFNTLPIAQTPAWRTGLISVIFSSLSVVLAYLTIEELIKNKTISLLTSLTVAFFYPFWIYAEVVEVFALNTFFAVLLLYLAIKFIRTQQTRYFYLLLFTFGFSLANNEVIILLAPVILLTFARNIRYVLKVKVIILSSIFFLLGLLPYVYIPIAASVHPFINSDNPTNFHNFLQLVLRKDYGWGVGSPHPFNGKPLTILFHFIMTNFSFPTIILAIIGVLYGIRKWTFISTIILIEIFLTGPFYFIYSRADLTDLFRVGVLERFFIIPGVLTIYFIGFGMYFVAQKGTDILDKIVSSVFEKKYSHIVFLILALLLITIPLTFFASNWITTDLHTIWFGDNVARDVLNDLPLHSVLIIYSDSVIYSTEYYQLSHNTRRDLIIPTDYNTNKEFIKLTKRLQGQSSAIVKKYPHIDSMTLTLLFLYSQRNNYAIYYLYPIPDSATKYQKDLVLIPHGVLLKIADNSDLNLSENDFESKQDVLLKSLHVNDIRKNLYLVGSNYGFIELRQIYAQAYINTGLYFSDHYHDVKKANTYILTGKSIIEGK